MYKWNYFLNFRKTILRTYFKTLPHKRENFKWLIKGKFRSGDVFSNWFIQNALSINRRLISKQRTKTLFSLTNTFTKWNPLLSDRFQENNFLVLIIWNDKNLYPRSLFPEGNPIPDLELKRFILENNGVHKKSLQQKPLRIN